VSIQYVTATVDELTDSRDAPVAIRYLNDSGSELCIIISGLLESLALSVVGKVRIRGVVRCPVEADLVKLHISLVADPDDNYDNRSIPVVCAVCPDLNEDIRLTSALMNRLQHQKADKSRGVQRDID